MYTIILFSPFPRIPKSQPPHLPTYPGSYTDGQMNDARLAVGLVTTAASHGATAVNHVEVTRLLKDSDGRITGAELRDTLDAAGAAGPGEPFCVDARVVINATGPFSDAVLRMDDPAREPVIKGSSGVHVILPSCVPGALIVIADVLMLVVESIDSRRSGGGRLPLDTYINAFFFYIYIYFFSPPRRYYSPSKTGLIIPKTSDGRVVFLLPWLDKTIAGTTDSPSAVVPLPRPKEEEIDFILSSISDYLKVDVRRSDVHAAWSGIRPLVTDPAAAAGTAGISREHIVHVSGASGLVSILGGKWTTARLMAEQGVDAAVSVARLSPKSPCKTESVRLLGAEGWNAAFFVVLAQGFTRVKANGARAEVDPGTAKHLSHAYVYGGCSVCNLFFLAFVCPL
jgi:glycerol-3-phosphate dehydrogenase